MANIQRDGTFSVIPRVAAGEITPDGLMNIGRIAKKYGLYTKITGGQRIDMFGAKKWDLPSIWEELIESGFESGQSFCACASSLDLTSRSRVRKGAADCQILRRGLVVPVRRGRLCRIGRGDRK